MARIGRLRDQVPSLTLAVGYMAPLARGGEVRDQVREDRRWYKTARWQRLRWSVLVAAIFTCRMCGRIEADTSRLVADHVVPHRGSEVLFWDGGNLQCLCEGCHSRAKQREEAAEVVPVYGRGG